MIKGNSLRKARVRIQGKEAGELERKYRGSKHISELPLRAPLCPVSVSLQSQGLSPHANIYPITPSEAPDHEE